jgi:CubicO group peptidase (beta-lactamase class C family)
MRCVLLLLAAAGAFAAGYWPSAREWRTAPDPALQSAAEYALANKSVSFLVLRGGKIAHESYAPGWDATKERSLASATKSITAVLLAMALEDGKLKSFDQPVADFAPFLRGTDRAGITVRHLMSMTSGLDHRGVAIDTTSGDQFVVNLNMKLRAQPGTLWDYNTPAYHTTFRLLEIATGEPFDAYARRKLFDPIGMQHYSWLSRKVGEVTNYYRLRASARDMARFGLFALRRGRWDGKRLLRESTFAELIRPSQNLNPAYGLLWWLNSQPGFGASEDGRVTDQQATRAPRFPGAPPDLFAALGAQGQLILVIPSRDLVIVRQGDTPGARDFAAELTRRVLTPPR